MVKNTTQEAIEYIYSKKQGIQENLIKNFGKDITDFLFNTGLIIRKANNWQITNDGSDFIETILPRKNFSIMERIQNKINDLII